MSAYPYPDGEAYPSNASTLDYQLNWNDRFDSGEPVRSYRFNYRLLTSTPSDDLAPEAKTWKSAMNEIVLAPAERQLELLRAGQVSVTELAEAHIRQIERLNPDLNVFRGLRCGARASAGAASRCSDRATRRAAWFAGDDQVFDCHSRVSVRNRQPAAQGRDSGEDAVVVGRLRAAGALILGTTNCPEFLMAYESANLLHGRVRNPWDLERSPGGSSGGESAAIAAGLSAGGLGSDSGGSVRVPAHFYGHLLAEADARDEFQAADNLPPCVGPFSILGAIGPLARTMGDVSVALSDACRTGPGRSRQPAGGAAHAFPR